MLALHPLAELAPATSSPAACSPRSQPVRRSPRARAALGDEFAQRFPTVYESCMAAGIDPAIQPIPVAPAAHYHMGGIGRPARPHLDRGLWAGGEVSSTGAHGANRLASNSLLEAVVFAARIAEDIDGRAFEVANPWSRHAPANNALPAARRAEPRARHDDMPCRRDPRWRGPGRRRPHLRRHRARRGHIALRNMATTALLVAAAAWSRHESRGGTLPLGLSEPKRPRRAHAP